MAEGLSQPRWWLKDDAGSAAAEEEDEAGDEPQQQHLGWDVVDHEQIAALACGVSDACCCSHRRTLGLSLS